MSKIISVFIAIILFHFQVLFGQTGEEKKYWENWNKNYPEVDIASVLKLERNYADSVEKHPEIIQYYTRVDKYSFTAEFLGQTRKMSPDILNSMKRGLKLFGGNPSQLEQLTGSQVLFKIADEEIWMCIQPNILKALKEELSKGDKPKLYCLYFNEHTKEKRLYNIFLISEFVK